MNNYNPASNIKIQMNNFTLNLQTLLNNDQDKLLPATYRKNTKTQRAKTNYEDISPIKVKKKPNNKDVCVNNTNKQLKSKKQQLANEQQLVKPQSKVSKMIQKKEKRQSQGNTKKIKRNQHGHTQSNASNHRSKSRKQKSTRLQRHFTDYDYVVESARLRTSPSTHFINNNQKKFNSQSVSKSGSKSRSKSFKKKKDTKSRSKSPFSTNNNERLITRKSIDKFHVSNMKVKSKQLQNQVGNSEKQRLSVQKKKRRLSKSKQNQYQPRKSIDQFGKTTTTTTITMMNKSKSRERIYTQVGQQYNNNGHFDSNNNNILNNNNNNVERISLSHKKSKLNQHYRQHSDNLISQSSDNGIVLGPKFASNKINSKEKVKQKSINKVKSKKTSGIVSVTNIHKTSSNTNRTKKTQPVKKQVNVLLNNSKGQQKALLAMKHKSSASVSSQNHFYQSAMANNIEKRKLTQSDLNNYFQKSKKGKRVKTLQGNVNQEECFDVHGLTSMKKIKKKDNNQEQIEIAFKKKKYTSGVSKLFQQSNSTKRDQLHSKPNPSQSTVNQLLTQFPKRRIKRQKNLTIQTTFRHEDKMEICFDDISKILTRRKEGESVSEEGRDSMCRSERSIKEEIMMERSRSGWWQDIGGKDMGEDIRRLRTEQLQDTDQQQYHKSKYSSSDNNNDGNIQNVNINSIYSDENVTDSQNSIEEQSRCDQVDQNEEDGSQGQDDRKENEQIRELVELNDKLERRIVKDNGQSLQFQNKVAQRQSPVKQSQQSKPIHQSIDYKKPSLSNNQQSIPQSPLSSSSYGIQNRQKVLRSLNKPRKSMDQQQRIARTFSNKKLLQQLQLLQTLQRIQKSVQNSLIYEGNEHYLVVVDNIIKDNVNCNVIVDKEIDRSKQQVINQYKTIDDLERQLLASLTSSPVINQAINQQQQKKHHEMETNTQQLVVDVYDRQESPLLLQSNQNQFKRSSPINKFDQFYIDNQLVNFINSKHTNQTEKNITNNSNTIRKQQQADSCDFELYRKKVQYSELALEFEKEMDDYLKDTTHCEKGIKSAAVNGNKGIVSNNNNRIEAQQQYHLEQKSQCQFFYFPINKADTNINNTQKLINQNNQNQQQEKSQTQLIQSQLIQYIVNELVNEFTALLSKKERILHKFLQYVSQVSVELMLDREGELRRNWGQQGLQMCDNNHQRKPLFDPFQALDGSNNANDNHTFAISNNQRQINQNQFLSYLQSKICASNQYIINLSCQLFNFVKTSPQHQRIFLTNINRSFGLKPLKTLRWMRKAFTENDQQEEERGNAEGNQQKEGEQQDEDQQESLSGLSENQQLQAVFSPILLADFDAVQNEIIFQQINQQQYYLNHSVYAALNEISDTYRPYGQNGPPVISKHKPTMNTSVILLQPKILGRLQALLSLRMGRTQFLPQQQPQKLITQSYKKMDEMIVWEENEKWSERNLEDLIFESKYYLSMYILDLIMNQEVMEVWRVLESER